LSRPTRRIPLAALNAVVYALIAGVLILYGSELRWALEAFPGYVDRAIPSPPERRLYSIASSLLDEGDLEGARGLLEESLAIDPNSNAAYWLADYYRRSGQEEAAVRQYRSYLDFDPTNVDAYLELAQLLRRTGQPEEARRVLEEGLEYYRGNAERYRPRPDEDVGDRYNEKAASVHEEYRRAGNVLAQELERGS
jgi:tetratricopeptide (TPR) repeat protein